MTPKRAKTLSDQLRRAIEASEKTRYVIAQETGIDQATLSRFMYRKGGLSTRALDLIAECLGLELVAKQPTSKGR